MYVLKIQDVGLARGSLRKEERGSFWIQAEQYFASI
jgi:hypothetical protein